MSIIKILKGGTVVETSRTINGGEELKVIKHRVAFRPHHRDSPKFALSTENG